MKRLADCLYRWARWGALFLFILGGWPAPAGAAPAHTILVTTSAESPGNPGDCTLGEAIQAANSDQAVDACAAGSGADTIVLPVNTYTLTTPISLSVVASAFVISTTITLQGNYASLTRGGPITNTLRFFYIASAGRLTLQNLTLKHGLALGADGGPAAGPGAAGGDGDTAFGGAIDNLGQLTLDGANFLSNNAQGGAGGAGSSSGAPGAGGQGGGAEGGAIANAGVILVASGGATFFNNTAQGGVGGPGGNVSLAGAAGGMGGLALGGAIVNDAVITGTAGPVVFSTNRALAGNGGNGGILAGDGGYGGIAQGGAIYNGTRLVLVQAGDLFVGNQATGGYGGHNGLGHATTHAGAGAGGALDSFTITVLGGVRFRQNSAAQSPVSDPSQLGSAYGGAVRNSGQLTLTNGALMSNTAQAGLLTSGGGLYNLGQLFMADDLVSGNQLLTTTTPVTHTFQGGGLSLFNAAVIVRTAIVSNTALSGGSAGIGGGIFALNDHTWLTNTTLAGNRADDGAGLWSANSTETMTHVSLAANTATANFALEAGGSGQVLLRNSLLGANAPATCGSSNITDGGGNLDAANSCQLTQPTSLTDTMPLIGPLANNGGSTLTFALLPGSAAIDAAVAAFCPFTDQRGVPRPAGHGCDIGAFERNFPVWLPLIRR